MKRLPLVFSTAGLGCIYSLGITGDQDQSAGLVPAPAALPAIAALLARWERGNDARIDGLGARRGATGAVLNAYGLPSPHETARLIVALAAAEASPGSRHRCTAQLAQMLEGSAAALLALQHGDGTIDLPETNFHSPPDTAFVLESMTTAASLLRRPTCDRHGAACAAVEMFIRRAGESLVVGGVHTPNHRWVVCGALARVHGLFPDARYLVRIDQWLAEGIDCDPDGQYSEKSTGGYSPVVDRALLSAARALSRPDLLEPVRRNLAMTLYYVHPGGEVATEASRRQDQYQRVTLARYYVAYRALALADGDGRFAALARFLERTGPDDLLVDYPTLLDEPDLQADLPPDAPLPTDYARVFAHSDLARIRRGDTSVTLLARNPTLLSLRHGAAALEALRLATSFFGRGQFEGERLEVADGVYRLRQRLVGPYFQPLPAGQVTPGEAVPMAPNGTLATDGPAPREMSQVQHLEAVVEVREAAGGGLTLAFHIDGTAGVPVAIELGFRAGGTLEGVTPVEGVVDAFLLRQGTGRYLWGDDVITFGPGRAEHTYTQLRGARPKWAGPSVYLTGLTPWHTTITFTGESSA